MLKMSHLNYNRCIIIPILKSFIIFFQVVNLINYLEKQDWYDRQSALAEIKTPASRNKKVFCREIYPGGETKYEITKRFKLYVGIFRSKESWRVELKRFFSELFNHKINSFHLTFR